MGKRKVKDEVIEEIDEKDEPKNVHGIQFNLNVNSKDASIVRDALISAGHIRLAETFETKRELQIMHEVLDARKNGENIFEVWRKNGNYYNGDNDSRKPKYKMKHKVLYAAKA